MNFFFKYDKLYKSFIKDLRLLNTKCLNLIKNNENIYISINNIKKRCNYYY